MCWGQPGLGTERETERDGLSRCSTGVLSQDGGLTEGGQRVEIGTQLYHSIERCSRLGNSDQADRNNRNHHRAKAERRRYQVHHQVRLHVIIISLASRQLFSMAHHDQVAPAPAPEDPQTDSSQKRHSPGMGMTTNRRGLWPPRRRPKAPFRMWQPLPFSRIASQGRTDASRIPTAVSRPDKKEAVLQKAVPSSSPTTTDLTANPLSAAFVPGSIHTLLLPTRARTTPAPHQHHSTPGSFPPSLCSSVTAQVYLPAGLAPPPD
ncbi:hypothetical protein QBC41DRAFT_126084 [Cercophora samala]|uniref:Uncharacterized protein n=1 Tax=Cercophora samala TaxID=330535 RepID=A0AA40DH98_9PEZI|nr:hypothetical protein QBC41DRAFT_126084 [Cercophora samala]